MTSPTIIVVVYGWPEVSVIVFGLLSLVGEFIGFALVIIKVGVTGASGFHREIEVEVLEVTTGGAGAAVVVPGLFCTGSVAVFSGATTEVAIDGVTVVIVVGPWLTVPARDASVVIKIQPSQLKSGFHYMK